MVFANMINDVQFGTVSLILSQITIRQSVAQPLIFYCSAYTVTPQFEGFSLRIISLGRDWAILR